MKKLRRIFLVGPTAVGKTTLSLSLAKKLYGEIISGDSMLFYRGFDIGTAKPTKKERTQIAHHLIDILAPTDSFNVMDFQQLANEKIRQLTKRAKTALIVGGTGLYVKSLLEGYIFNKTTEDKAYRKHLETLAKENGKPFVHKLLQKVDPQTAAQLHFNDFRRVVRALEVKTLANEHISKKRENGTKLPEDTYVIGLYRDRKALYERIEKRVDAMLATGFVNEVQGLLASGVSPDCQAMKAIGYREIYAYLTGRIDFPSAIAEIKKATRHFAKRQLTWFRKMPYVHWYAADQEETLLLEKICIDIENFSMNLLHQSHI